MYQQRSQIIEGTEAFGGSVRWNTFTAHAVGERDHHTPSGVRDGGGSHRDQRLVATRRVQCDAGAGT